MEQAENNCNKYYYQYSYFIATEPQVNIADRPPLPLPVDEVKKDGKFKYCQDIFSKTVKG